MEKISSPSIQVLPPQLAEKIAAGEVIERPGSAIKELIENSIDARATRIRVDLIEGGRKKISIQDNGFGIREDQALLALQRHATSKIRALEDLWNLSSMGFRGEALPSIAAISRFTLETKTAEGSGRQVYLEGAEIKSDTALSPTALLDFASGTRITVEDLFYNVPARLKFQKSKNSEQGFVRDLIERLSLSHPEIEFELYSEQRRTLHLKPVADLASRVAQIFETEVSQLEPFHTQFDGISIAGFLDLNTRAVSSQSIYLSVNKRMVRDKLLHQAVLKSLRSRMMEGEYPKIYLSLTISPEAVDVNVHPAKSEVRFQRSGDVFQLIYGGLEKLALHPKQNSYLVDTGTGEIHEPLNHTKDPFRHSLPYEDSWNPSPQESNFIQNPLFENPGVQYARKENLTQHGTQYSAHSAPQTDSPPALSLRLPTIKNGFLNLQYIGQLKNTYLLFQDTDGLVLVDQHAAHERINYEKIKSAYLQKGLRPQQLLLSITVKLKPEEAALALDYQATFQEFGFELEVFGEDCILLRAVPEYLEEKLALDLFKSLLDEIKNTDGETLLSDPSKLSPKYERLVATQACHSSVRAGQPLSPFQAEALVAEMENTPSSLNCPHGRPASIKLKFDQIENLFKRRV